MKSKTHSYLFLALWLVLFILCSVLSGLAYSTEPTVDQPAAQTTPAKPLATEPADPNDDPKPPATQPGTEDQPSPYDSLVYSANNAGYVIYVDAGHGWADNGTHAKLTADGEFVYEVLGEDGKPLKDADGKIRYVTESGKEVTEADFTYIFEKDITIQLTKKLKTALEKMGYQVGETRPGDSAEDCPVSLNQYGLFNAMSRVEYINQVMPHYFLSLHCNSHTASTTRGTRLYYYSHAFNADKVAPTQAMASKLLASLSENMGLSATLHDQNLAIPRGTTMPSLIIETGFITNHEDLLLMTDPDWQDQFVCALARGLDAHIHS